LNLVLIVLVLNASSVNTLLAYAKSKTGLVLWKKDLAEWLPHLWPLKNMPASLPRRLVSVGDELFVTLGIHVPVSRLNAIDGAVKRVFAGSERCEEIIVTDKLVLALCLTGKEPLDVKIIKHKIKGTAHTVGGRAWRL